MSFNIEECRRQYHYDFYTLVHEQLPEHVCERMVERLHKLIENGAIPLVDHDGLGTAEELDGGGRYLHYLVDGLAIREHFLELEGSYYALANLIAAVTSADVVTSPYPDSDINIKAYPPGGGTLGAHYDTNGITVLVYLTTNSEGPLRLRIERHDPWKGMAMERPDLVTDTEIFARAGTMLLMQGRKVWHDSKPTLEEFKAVAVFNYYERGDTRRPGHFDDFVYRGVDPVEAAERSQAA